MVTLPSDKNETILDGDYYNIDSEFLVEGLQ
jgi:hypothetical protein